MTEKCIPCKYETSDKSNYTKHIKSDKHLTIIDALSKLPIVVDNSHLIHLPAHRKDFECKYCGTIFELSSSLSRHKAKCSDKLDYNACAKLQKEHDVKILEYKDQINKLIKDHTDEINK
jgi:hypothetical protein